jgi:hypothetical protein
MEWNGQMGVLVPPRERRLTERRRITFPSFFFFSLFPESTVVEVLLDRRMEVTLTLDQKIHPRIVAVVVGA